MVCWYLCITSSLRPDIPAPPGYRCPRTIRKEGRRQSPLGHLEDTLASTPVLLRRHGHRSGYKPLLTRPKSG